MAKKRSEDRHATPRIAVHLEQALLDALDRFCAAQRVPVDRSQAVRTAIAELLEREGLWPAKGGGA